MHPRPPGTSTPPPGPRWSSAGRRSSAACSWPRGCGCSPGYDAAAGRLAAVLRYRVRALSGRTPADVAVRPVAPSAALPVHPLPHVPGPTVATLPTTDFRPRPPARP